MSHRNAHRAPLLPAGVHLLPFVREGDGALAIVVVNHRGEAVVGPAYVAPGIDPIDEAARLLAFAERTAATPAPNVLTWTADTQLELTTYNGIGTPDVVRGVHSRRLDAELRTPLKDMVSAESLDAHRAALGGEVVVTTSLRPSWCADETWRTQVQPLYGCAGSVIGVLGHSVRAD